MLQTQLSENVVVDAVEGGAQVKQTEKRDFLAVGGGEDVGQNTQRSSFCRMVFPIDCKHVLAVGDEWRSVFIFIVYI